MLLGRDLRTVLPSFSDVVVLRDADPLIDLPDGREGPHGDVGDGEGDGSHPRHQKPVETLTKVRKDSFSHVDVL